MVVQVVSYDWYNHNLQRQFTKRKMFEQAGLALKPTSDFGWVWFGVHVKKGKD